VARNLLLNKAQASVFRGNESTSRSSGVNGNCGEPPLGFAGPVQLQAFGYTTAVNRLRTNETQRKSRLCNSDLNIVILIALHETHPTFGLSRLAVMNKPNRTVGLKERQIDNYRKEQQ